MTDISHNRAPAPDAAPTSCGICGRPIVDEYYGVANRVACPQCAEQVRGMLRRNDFDASAVARGAAAGLPAAIVAAVVWAAVAKFAKMEVGILAVGIGWLV